jgi:hypothetical protein
LNGEFYDGAFSLPLLLPFLSYLDAEPLYINDFLISWHLAGEVRHLQDPRVLMDSPSGFVFVFAAGFLQMTSFQVAQRLSVI